LGKKKKTRGEKGLRLEGERGTWADYWMKSVQTRHTGTGGTSYFYLTGIFRGKDCEISIGLWDCVGRHGAENSWNAWGRGNRESLREIV